MKKLFNNAREDDDTYLAPKVIYGLDRITVWLDRPELPVEHDRLEKYCTDIKVVPMQMQFNPQWKLQVQLFQPKIKCLQIFKVALGNNIAALPNYAEIAADIPVSSKRRAGELRDAFLSSAKMKYQRQCVVLDNNETIYYFGRRTDVEGNKRGHVLAVYADRPSKLLNAQPDENDIKCLHIEWRTTGAAELARFGMASIDDTIRFNHPHFWDDHTFMYELPKPTELGRILASNSGCDPNVSGTALRNRAARWRAKYSINGKFVMHNALLDTPNIEKHFKKLSFQEWLKMMMQ